MLKYCLTAIALKAFSCSPATKNLYRRLGNTIGKKRRASEKMRPYYLERINNLLRMSKKYKIPEHGSKIIEIGTGWLHWEAITMRLFFDVHGVLFDVWDNRQLKGLKNYVIQLRDNMFSLDIDSNQSKNAQKLISKIIDITNYEDLYKLLGFKYVVNRKGFFDNLEKETFDIIVSAGVLEHIYLNELPCFVKGIYELLKVGGYSMHSINIRDHLYPYDKTVSLKQYLKYNDQIWNLFFNNDVQYINRVQRSEWLHLFNKNGFTLVEEDVVLENKVDFEIAKCYKKYDDIDIKCGGLRILHKKAFS